MSNHNIHKSSHDLFFWASDPLINRFYWNLSIKGSEAQKQRPHKLLWMLWFDEKNISNWCIWLFRSCYAHQKKLNEKIWTPKKMWRIYSCIFFVKMAHCTKLTTRCTIPAAQFFQTFKNETLTRGASLTTTILYLLL